MSENLPFVTVVIPARPGQAEVKAAAASRTFDYPADRLEVIIARGKQPSAQRNAAMKAARGDIIYFLDDDSVPLATNLQVAVAHFRRRDVQMVGGPNLCPPEAPALQQVFALVLASKLAFGPSCARYARVGKVRPTSEKELILCNLLARRGPLLELGGFDEALYPNEENALMDDIQKRGGALLYDPALVVYRHPRSNLKSFAKMLMTYGRGRAEQFRLHPTLGSILNFVPPAFCIYCVAFVLALIFFPAWSRLLSWPLIAYGLVVAAHVLISAAKGNFLRNLATAPLIVLTHILYGFGFLRGLFTPLTPPNRLPQVPVELETIAGESLRSRSSSHEERDLDQGHQRQRRP